MKIFAGLLAVPIPLALKPAIWGTVIVGAGGAAAAAGVAAGVGGGSLAGAGAAGGAAGSAGAAAGGFLAAVAAVGPIGMIVAAAALVAVVGVGGFLAITGGDDTAPPDDSGDSPAVAGAPGTTAPAEPFSSTEVPATTAPDEPISSTTLPETVTTTTAPVTTTTSPPAVTTTTEAVVPPPPTTTVAPPAPPVANDDTATVDEDGSVTIDVLANDTGDGLDPASVTVASGPSSGTAVANPAGTVTYTPDTAFSGADDFTYSVTGESGDTSAATVAVTVTAVNDAPEVDPLALTVPEDTPEGDVVGTVSATDADGDPLTFSGSGDGFEVQPTATWSSPARSTPLPRRSCSPPPPTTATEGRGKPR